MNETTARIVRGESLRKVMQEVVDGWVRDVDQGDDTLDQKTLGVIVDCLPDLIERIVEALA